MASMDRARNLKESNYRGADIKLFVRDVRDRLGKKRLISVRSWSTIKDVKQKIQVLIHVPPSSQRLYFGPLLTSGRELPNHRSLQDAGIYQSGETLLLDIKSAACPNSNLLSTQRFWELSSSAVGDVCISSSMIDFTSTALRQIVQQARRGIVLGLKPEYVLDGSGGTYFLHDARKVKVAVFKPADEEPYAENNPKGYLRQDEDNSLFLRDGIVPGEACIREVAAYLLDHKGFSGVPKTTLAEAHHPAFNGNGARLKVSEGGAFVGSHSINDNRSSASTKKKKVGSFQEFCRSDFTMDDISPSLLSVEEVHKIAILDIRIMNADRNSANLLCRRNQDDSLELIPIDHGFSLRSVGDVSWMDWCWLDWPQMKKPLCERMKSYILSLDIEADVQLLQERLNICSRAIDYFRASSKLLQTGVRAGLSLYDIACICCRNDDLGEIPSKLERLFTMASELAESAIENGRWHHTAASRALVEQLSPCTQGSIPVCKTDRMSTSTSKTQLKDVFQSLGKEQDYPTMAQSSASESSLEAEEGIVEAEDCEEWAAAIIADVSLDKSMALTKERRSLSIGSIASDDSGLSNPSKGFWHIHPGSPSGTFSDDESVSWSPCVTPKALLQSHCDESLHNLSMCPPLDQIGTKQQQRQSVTFKDDYEDLYLQCSTELKDVDDIAVGLTRSSSYTALSAIVKMHNDHFTKTCKAHKNHHHGNKNEKLRDYFLKFVDLVIGREITTAASLQSQAGKIPIFF